MNENLFPMSGCKKEIIYKVLTIKKIEIFILFIVVIHIFASQPPVK